MTGGFPECCIRPIYCINFPSKAKGYAIIRHSRLFKSIPSPKYCPVEITILK